MNILDYMIIGFLFFLLIRGIFRGFVREISSVAGVVLGVWLGNLYQPWLTGILKQYLPLHQYLPLLAFIILFLAILFTCNILGWALKLLFRKTSMSGLDMGLGSGLAVLKGIIITYLAIVVLTFYLSDKTPLIAKSTLTPWIIKSYQGMTRIISPDHYKNWKNKLVGESKSIGDAASEKLKDLVKDNE